MTAQLVVNHEQTIGSTDWMRIRSDVGDEREFTHLIGQTECMAGGVYLCMQQNFCVFLSLLEIHVILNAS